MSEQEDRGSYRPRHRQLLEEVLAHQADRQALADPHRSLVRWKVPTGFLYLLALALSAFLVWQFLLPLFSSQQLLLSSDPQPLASTSEAYPTPSPLTLSQQPASGQLLVVHVAGSVQQPGVYELEEGSRVHQALEAAGGPLEGADLAAINQAALLSDGQFIYLPALGEQLGDGPTGQLGSPSGPATGSLVNINQASAEQLQTLPKVGPVTAGAIIQWRQEHGGFKSLDELEQVPGIGPATLEAIRPLVTL